MVGWGLDIPCAELRNHVNGGKTKIFRCLLKKLFKRPWGYAGVANVWQKGRIAAINCFQDTLIGG